MEIIILVIAYIVIIVRELIPLIKKKNPKDTLVYIGCLTLSFMILLLFNLGMKIPSPTNLIKAVVKIFTG
jgi:cell division protein FtsW (lipid II flippase)